MNAGIFDCSQRHLYFSITISKPGMESESSTIKVQRAQSSSFFGIRHRAAEEDVETPRSRSLSPPSGLVSKSTSGRRHKSRFSSRLRGSKMSAETVAIRDQILAKDYAVQRLEKLIRKRGGQSNSNSNSVGGGTNNNSSATAQRNSGGVSSGPATLDLLRQMEVLLREMDELKAQYLRVTGQPYEDKGGGRIRAALYRRKTSKALATAAAATATAHSVTSTPSCVVSILEFFLQCKYRNRNA